MELFAADGHDAGGCERVTGTSRMRPFETATSRRDSACAVGLAAGCDGRIVASRTYLIRPPRPIALLPGLCVDCGEPAEKSIEYTGQAIIRIAAGGGTEFENSRVLGRSWKPGMIPTAARMAHIAYCEPCQCAQEAARVERRRRREENSLLERAAAARKPEPVSVTQLGPRSRVVDQNRRRRPPDVWSPPASMASPLPRSNRARLNRTVPPTPT